MKKIIFSVATVVFLTVAISSCKKRPDISDSALACKKNCNSGNMNSDVMCKDRCNCHHTDGQTLDKCNKDYDESMAMK